MTELDQERITILSQLLLQARADGQAVAPPPPELLPTTVEEAEHVDDAVAASIGRPVAGWKIGCTSEHAQQLLGTDGPFAGRIYDLHPSGQILEAADLVNEPHLEGEFAFTIGRDLAPAAERSRQEVVDAVASVRPAIEIVGGRYDQFRGVPVHFLIADAGANSRLIVGAPVTDWDPDGLATTTATMTVEGEITGQGHGRDVLGDPIVALQWLVNRLSLRGITLPSGATVTTGTATQVSALPPGATAVATIDGIGSVTLQRAS